MVTVALARLRTDFELNAAQIKRELAAQTPDGIFKKDEHKISQNLRGVERGTLRTHIIKMGRPLELYDNDEALALTKSAEKIGLKASFSYNTGHDRSIHHPDNTTTSSELDAMSAGGRIFLTLTRL